MKSFIVEGPDNSGKSTLVAVLAKALNMKVVHNTKPTCIEEFKDVVKAEVESTNTIFDRGMAISQSVYDIVLDREPIMTDAVLLEYTTLELRYLPVIFCLPPENVVLAVPDNRPEMEGVAANRAALYAGYCELGHNLSNLHTVVYYDYTRHSVDDAIDWLTNAMGISDV